MADEGRDVNRKRCFLYLAQKIAYVEAGAAAIARHQGRDAHANEVLGLRVAVNILGVGVNIDEARRDDLVFRVNVLLRIAFFKPSNLRDTPVFYRDRTAKPRIARTVDYPRIANYQIVRCLLSKDRAGRDSEQRE